MNNCYLQSNCRDRYGSFSIADRFSLLVSGHAEETCDRSAACAKCRELPSKVNFFRQPFNPVVTSWPPPRCWAANKSVQALDQVIAHFSHLVCHLKQKDTLNDQSLRKLCKTPIPPCSCRGTNNIVIRAIFHVRLRKFLVRRRERSEHLEYSLYLTWISTKKQFPCYIGAMSH